MDGVLNAVSEAALANIIGQDSIERAEASLAIGKVVDRTFLSSGRITARWDSSSRSPVMRITNRSANEILMQCTCKEFSPDNPLGCQHLHALFLAWIRYPDSFVVEDETTNLLEEFFGSLDFDEDEDEDYDEDEDFFEDEEYPHIPSAGASSRAPAQESYDPLVEYQNLLNSLTLPEIREIARRRNVPISGQRKDPIVETLARVLVQPEKLAEDWPKLSVEARQLAGVIPFFLQRFLQPQDFKILANSAGLKDRAAVESAMEELRQFGIAFIDRYGSLRFPTLLPYWLPQDPALAPPWLGNLDKVRVQEALPPGALLRKTIRMLLLLQSEGMRVVAQRQEANVAKSLPFLYGWPVDSRDVEPLLKGKNPLQAIRQQGLRVNPAPSPVDEAGRQKLAEVLQATPEAVDWSLRVLSQLALIHTEPGKPVQADPAAIANTMGMDPFMLAKTLFARSASLEGWTEFDLTLVRNKTLRFTVFDLNQGPYQRLVGEINLFRHMLLLLIRRQPAGQWVDLAELAGLVYRMPFAKQLEAVGRYIKVGFQGKTLQLNQQEDWRALFGQFQEALLTGPLYWQSMVDLAWDQNRLVAYRLTDYGAALISQRQSYPMPVQESAGPSLSFTAEGNLLLNHDYGERELLGLLSLLGEPGVSPDGRILYQPTLEGAGRAFGAGWALDRILAVLQTASGQPLPAVLSETLHRWWENYGSLQLYGDVALIELGDDYALNELLAGTALSRYLLFRFSPRLVVIRREGVEPLRDEMVKKGYTPRTAA